jgi:predicted nucleotidyltransferase
MSLRPMNVIEKVIQQAKADPNVSILWLYGSRAAGQEQESSDLKLCHCLHAFPADPWNKE